VVEVPELAQDPLGELARLLEQEGIVGTRDQEDVHDAVAHQVVEVPEPAAPLGLAHAVVGDGHQPKRIDRGPGRVTREQAEAGLGGHEDAAHTAAAGLALC